MSGTTTQGRRRPDNTPTSEMEAGDYAKHTWRRQPHWQCRDPSGRVGSFGEGVGTGHTVTEHEDGSVTVSPSLLDPDGWHGYLERGVWREC